MRRQSVVQLSELCGRVVGPHEVSESTVSYPLFVAEGLDLSLFRSIPEAERGLEGVDVADGIYRGFDAEGRTLKLEARGVRKGHFTVEIGTVHISLAESRPAHAGELQQLLRDHLEAFGEHVESSAELNTAGNVWTLTQANV